MDIRRDSTGKVIRELTSDDRIWFGKWKGERLADIPVGWFNYVWNNGAYHEESSIANYIRENLEDLMAENDSLDWAESEI